MYFVGSSLFTGYEFECSQLILKVAENHLNYEYSAVTATVNTLIDFTSSKSN